MLSCPWREVTVALTSETSYTPEVPTYEALLCEDDGDVGVARRGNSFSLVASRPLSPSNLIFI